MKKTLVALAVTAFATSASALTVYEQDGTKVDFDGSIRLILEKSSTKVTGEKRKDNHSTLHNDGSRFGVKMKHNINDDFYALGRVEFRFNSEAKGSDGFGDLYAHRAYVGLGSQGHEVTFGRQVTIGDDITQAGFDNRYGNWDGALTGAGKSVVRYDYRKDGLHAGVGYRFAEDRVTEEEAKADPTLVKGEVKKGKLKSGYDAGIIYDFGVGEGQSVKLSAGYSRDNFVTATNHKHHKDAWGASAGYTVNDLTLAVDYAGYFKKDGATKERLNGVRGGVKYNVTPEVSVYSNYGYGVSKTKASNVTTEKKTVHSFIVGSSYQIHKNVFSYVEGGVIRVNTEKASGKSKETESGAAVGLRVFW